MPTNFKQNQKRARYNSQNEISTTIELRSSKF